MALTADTWPIAGAMLPFPDAHPVRSDLSDELAGEWRRALDAARRAGFDAIDLTDSWLRPGDLSAAQLDALARLAAASGLRIPSISVIRRSVIDERLGDQHLAYSHRTLDAAAELGAVVVSVGLHRPLTEAQRRRLWFWTAEGHRDDFGDPEARGLAVTRFRELGRHAAELGLLLSLELYEHTYLGTAESAVRLVEQIDLPNVGLNPDIGNLVRLHEPVEDWRELVRDTLPYANFWHVKNYHRDEDPVTGAVLTLPSYLENGLIDYREAFRVAIESGFQGVICAEHYGGDGLSVSAANRDYLRERVLPTSDYTPGQSLVDQRIERASVRPEAAR